MSTSDRFALVRSGNLKEIFLAPAESVPIHSQQGLGPCLLGPGPNADWIIGHWDGFGWYSEDGSAVSPVVWAPLPPICDVIAQAKPRTLAGAIAILEQIGNDEDQTHPEAIKNVLLFLRELAGTDGVEFDSFEVRAPD